MPTSGAAFLAGTCVSQQSADKNCPIRLRQLSFVYQHETLFFAATLEENVAVLCSMVGVSFDQEYFLSLVDSFNLSAVYRRPVFSLSGGERQRATIIRALMLKPKILFADEPTSQLDVETSAKVMDILFAWVRTHNSCLVMATHDLKILNSFTHHLSL